MEPYMAPGHATSQKMKLLGVISHQGTKEHGHYVAITKRGNEWISHNDAITTQTTQTHLHQSQAYVLMYRKIEQSAGTEKEAPRAIASQQLPTEKPKPSHETLHSGKPLLHPDPQKRENPPRQGRPEAEINPNPTQEEPTKVNRKAPETPPDNSYAPQAIETRGEGEAGGRPELDGVSVPPTEKADHRDKPPPEDKGTGTGQFENGHSNLPQSISAFLHLSQGRIEELTSLLSELSGTPLTMEMTINWQGLEPHSKEIPQDSQNELIDCLSEDPEDHPAGFIIIIERHNARLTKAHLLLEATRDIIQRKWTEDTTLGDIGKFLQCWAPEPYRNKPMPKGMIQALLNITPNSQAWAPTDLSNCIFRNTEATDSIEDVVRAVGNMGTLEEPTLQDSKRTSVDGPDLIRIFPRKRTLHDIRRDWLSDEELWLAIPEGETLKYCLTHAPRHSWKLMVEFFLALNTYEGSWIHNLERRDMMLLGSLTENIFGFTGTYAKKQQASHDPILTGWKRWTEYNTTSNEKTPKDGWLVNLRIAGSVSTSTVEKAVSWNVGPHGYQRGKCFPITGSISPRPRVPRKTEETDHMYIRF